MWRVAAPLLVYGAALQLFSKIDLFALSALRGATADVGLYAAAQNLAVPPGLFALALSPLLLATLGRLLRTDARADARRVARDALRVAIVLLPLAAVVAGTAGEIVRLVFGASFAGAGVLLALLFTAGVAMVVMSVAVAAITAADEQRMVSWLGVGILGTALLGHLLLIPRLGAIGAALGLLLILAAAVIAWGLNTQTGARAIARIAVNALGGKLALGDLLGALVHLHDLQASGIEVTLHEPTKPPEPSKPFTLKAPIDVAIDTLVVDSARIRRGVGTKQAAERREQQR